MSRRRGFTLIELLVVIAIIGILAAMLFPVFARARESARKTQCLANVKNIAIGMQMYLTDYDKFFPLMTDMAVGQWFHDNGHRGAKQPIPCNQTRHADPYLREPVILDEYIKSREVWRCPSAKLTTGAARIVPMGRDGYWLNNFIDHPNYYTDYMCPPCEVCWPTGWGGSVTDSFVQGAVQTGKAGNGTSAGSGVFVMGVTINDSMHWDTPASVQDSAHYVTCGDSNGSLSNANHMAYPDYCYGTSNCGFASGCQETACVADWSNCTWSQTCGLDGPHKIQFFNDANYRKSLARHMGGSNVGFMDGHAKWFPAEAIIFQGTNTKDAIFEGGICPCWYPNIQQ
jgi:prepilin-type N-terminal cleavage/methylation domain-containing protein/prepilin-type processing-associated H-X9-DG protein